MVAHSWAEIEQIISSLPPEAQIGGDRLAMGRKTAGGKFIALALAGAVVDSPAEPLVFLRATAGKLGKIQRKTSLFRLKSVLDKVYPILEEDKRQIQKRRMEDEQERPFHFKWRPAERRGAKSVWIWGRSSRRRAIQRSAGASKGS